MQLIRIAVVSSCAFTIIMLQSSYAGAQGFCHYRASPFYGMQAFPQRIVVFPGYVPNTVPNPYYPIAMPTFHSSEYVRRLYDFPTHPVAMPSASTIDPGFMMLTPGVDPLKIPPKPSPPSAVLKSLNLQAKGDLLLRDQKWSEARAAFSGAVYAAPDRAESHLRLAMCYVAVRRYDSAVKQIKRAVFLDPTLPRTGKKLLEIFGPDNTIALSSIIAKLADWVKDDQLDSDRLFLLAAVLHFNDDPSSSQYFDAAKRTYSGSDLSHITLFLNSHVDDQNQQGPIDGNGLPKLNDQPQPTIPNTPKGDLRFPNLPKALVPAPVPMPDV